MNRTNLLLMSLVCVLLSAGLAFAQEAAPPQQQAAPPQQEAAPPQATPAPPKATPQPPVETLMADEGEHGGFGGPVLMFSRIQGRDAFLFGGRGGWIADHRFVIGGGGFGLTSRVRAPSSAPGGGENLQLGFGYGGLWLEYIFLPHKLVHGSFGTLFGAGGVSYTRIQNVAGEPRAVESTTVFVVDPTLSAELNVFRFMRIDVGVGYRFVGGLDLTGLDPKALNGFTGTLMFKFGSF